MSCPAVESPSVRGWRLARLLLLLTALLATLLTLGCKQSPTADQVRLELEQQLPGAHFERESHLHMGRISMGAVRQVLRFTMPEDSSDRKLIAGLKRIDVTTYRVVSLPRDPAPSSLSVLQRRLEKAGWTLLLKEQDFDEQTWVLYREDEKGAIRSLCVVSLDSYELEVVSVDGRLDELMAQAIADDPSGFVASLGP